MTRTKKGKPATTPKEQTNAPATKDLPIRWYNPSPDNADVEWLDGNLINSMEDAFTLFDSLSGEQRLSCKLDLQSGRWMAILFGVGLPEKGYIPAMSARGATAADALILLSYFAVRKTPDWGIDLEVEYPSRFG